ncbi:MAG: BlaI/MecI/CopY family transcriptional regulator [Bacteroidales bacterium]|nr:BlaI/MecI/CopY family transcriptional regulator [Bacteroidales bacterium]
MKALTRKEERIMDYFWREGALFVRELRELYPDPKPHFNTLSTQVRTLESEGFLSHEVFGPTYRYRPAVSREDYSRSSLSVLIDKCFDRSYLLAVSTLVQDEKISVDELKALIDRIEKGKDA